MYDDGMMDLVDNKGTITTEDANDVIMLCCAWTVDRPNDSAHKLYVCKYRKKML